MAKTKATEKDFLSFFDKLPPLGSSLRRMTGLLEEIAGFYGFEIIHTPLIEDARQMSSLARAGMLDDRQPILCKTGQEVDFGIRPSIIPGIFRAYAEHKLNDWPHPLKFIFSGESFYVSSLRSHGNRLRNISELGLCMIGEEGAIAEAEIIQVIWRSLEKFGADAGRLRVRVNATACNECRPSFRSALLGYLRPKAHKFCKQCKRFIKKSPTKVLQCAEEQCIMFLQNVPQVLDHLCESCKKHLRGFLEFLDEAKISYFLDPKLFKDGSLYHSLVFELTMLSDTAVSGIDGKESPGTQSGNVKAKTGGTLFAEGGRVSRVAELMTGKRLDVAAGVIPLESLESLLVNKGVIQRELRKPRIFLAQLGDLAKRKSLSLIEELRSGDIRVHESLGRDSVKSQLKVAERIGAEISLILGQKEALDGTIIVREMKSGMQETISQERLGEFLKKKLRIGLF